MKEFISFEDLENSIQTSEGQKFVCRERNNAEYILQPSGYTPLAGDVTFANGRVGALQIDGMANVLWFGAVADWNGVNGTDNYDAFMDAKTRASHVFVPDGSYMYSTALRMDKFDFVLECESPKTYMFCKGDNPSRFPAYSCVLLGTYLASNITNTPTFGLNNVILGSESLTLSDANDAENFSVGDVVFVRSVSAFTITPYDVPTWGKLNVVAGISGSEITLESPIEEEGGAVIANLTTNTYNYHLSDGTNTGTPNFASKNVKIIGGSWESGNEEGSFSGAGGAINCVIDVHSAKCRNGIAYGNLNAFNTYKCVTQRARKASTELAYCSHDNIVNIINDCITDNSLVSTSATAAVWINESSSSNKINIQNLNCSDFEVGNVVEMLACRDNQVEIGKVTAENVTDSVIEFYDAGYSGVKPNTKNNRVIIHSSTSDADDCVRFRGGSQEIENCAIIKSYGNHTNAVKLESNSVHPIIKDSIFTSGSIINQGALNPFIANSYVDGGINLSGDYDGELDGEFNGLSSAKSRLLKKSRIISLSSNATNSSPFSKSRVVTAGAFNLLDRIDVYFSALIPGGSSTANKNFSLDFGGNAVIDYNTATTSGELIIEGGFTYATNSDVIGNFVLYENDDVKLTRVITIGSLDLLLNDYNLTMTVTPSDPTDTINIRDFRVNPKSANVGEM